MGSPEVASLGAVMARVGRSVASEAMVARRLGLNLSPMLLGEGVLSAAFVGLSLGAGGALSMVLYALCYGVYLFVFRRDLTVLVARVRHGGRGR